MGKKALLTCGRNSSMVQLTHVGDNNPIYVVIADISAVTTCITPASTAICVGGQMFYVTESVQDILFLMDK